MRRCVVKSYEILHQAYAISIKFFEERLIRGTLFQMGRESRVTITCSMGYYNGTREYIIDGGLQGRIVAPRDGEGFGFDFGDT